MTTDLAPPPPQPLPANIMDFFPLDEARPKQVTALDFFIRTATAGFRDIIIAAPTGVGKSAIASAIAFWASQASVKIVGEPGAYVLCNQKLLQDQYENEIDGYRPGCQDAASLKTASEYACTFYNDCGSGQVAKPICGAIRSKSCTYHGQRGLFLLSRMAITNYAYFFTERLNVGKFPTRRVIVFDEAHNTENVMLRFIELEVGPTELKTHAPHITTLPVMPERWQFMKWLDSVYLPALKSRLDAFEGEDQLTEARAKELSNLTSHIKKIVKAMAEVDLTPKNWVYWQHKDNETGALISTAKPIDAAPFFEQLAGGGGTIRVYLSAYPGNKKVFCRSLGLDPNAVAAISLGSVFPKENRAIHAAFVGSMSKNNLPQTLPGFLRTVGRISDLHKTEKGVIHVASYALAKSVYDHFAGTPFGKRLLFPRKADERDAAFEAHKKRKDPTVILSPSFTEGFDFRGDLARWQIIGKVAYPYLGDPQVAAKKDRDPEWYDQCAISSLIQASGRGTRSATDYCVTYILDEDFKTLYDRRKYMFPQWWLEAIVWPE
jgi:ATP-dependent DNA helicase DinG